MVVGCAGIAQILMVTILGVGGCFGFTTATISVVGKVRGKDAGGS